MLREFAGKKALLVSSTGGHLAELVALADAAEVSDESLWVVPDTPQSRSLLRGRRTKFVPYVGPRAIGAALRAAVHVAAVLRQERFDYSISTGAAIAAFTLPLAATRSIRSVYIESLARSEGPSLTGRILRLVPRVWTMTQSPFWATRYWPYAGTVIDEFVVEERATPNGPLRVLVTLGTIRPYRFDRAVDAILAVLEPDDKVVWQLGASVRDDLPGHIHREMSADDLRREMSLADVVLTHAGVGSVLDSFAVGRLPVLLVRQQSSGEHVDDHQRQLAQMLTTKKLGVELDLRRPDRGLLLLAARHRIRPARSGDDLEGRSPRESDAAAKSSDDRDRDLLLQHEPSGQPDGCTSGGS